LVPHKSKPEPFVILENHGGVEELGELIESTLQEVYEGAPEGVLPSKLRKLIHAGLFG